MAGFELSTEVAVKRILDDYPDATAVASGQRRSVHLEFPTHDLHLDIVPAVAENGIEAPVKVPDRPLKEWIDSHPLGYREKLTALNQKHGERLRPLIKLVKAWRDVQMTIRRPKSYVLEVMVYHAVNDGEVTLVGNSTATNFAHFVSHVTAKVRGLLEEGKEAPRVSDPETAARISAGWQRSHFSVHEARA